MKPRRYVRADCEYLGGSRVKYTYPCGHTRTETVTVGRGRLKRTLSPDMVAKLARYWSMNKVLVDPCRCGRN